MPSKKWSDIAAEEDDLQSVNAGTASSTVMADGEASENETQQSDVSRLSKWRPSSSKSSGKKGETAEEDDGVPKEESRATRRDLHSP